MTALQHIATPRATRWCGPLSELIRAALNDQIPNYAYDPQAARAIWESQKPGLVSCVYSPVGNLVCMVVNHKRFCRWARRPETVAACFPSPASKKRRDKKIAQRIWGKRHRESLKEAAAVQNDSLPSPFTEADLAKPIRVLGLSEATATALEANGLGTIRLLWPVKGKYLTELGFTSEQWDEIYGSFQEAHRRRLADPNLPIFSGEQAAECSIGDDDIFTGTRWLAPDDILDYPVKHMKGVRQLALDALVGAGITTIEQLTHKMRSELLRIPGIGPVAVDQIEAWLAEEDLQEDLHLYNPGS